MGYLFLLLLVLIICVTILFAMYMYYCSENNMNMFSDSKYNERLCSLEKTVSELQEKTKGE